MTDEPGLPMHKRPRHPRWDSIVLQETTPATITCGSCEQVLLSGPITVPQALLAHLKPCGHSTPNVAAAGEDTRP